MLWWMLLVGCRGPAALTEAQIDAAVAHAADVQPDDLIATVTEVVATRASEKGIRPDPWDPPYRREAAGAWVLATLLALGLEAETQTGMYDAMPVRNVAATIAGTTRPDEVVLVTAHHDVWFTGADDNTSGVVALVAIAAALRDTAPDRTIRLVATDWEEISDDYIGTEVAYDHADQVVAHINLDAIAYTDRRPGSQKAPPGFTLPDTGDFIAVIGNGPADHLVLWATQLAPEVPHPVRVLGVFGVDDNPGALLSDLHRSDHSPSWKRGVPAAFFNDTSDLRSPHYHQESDVVDTLDPVFFAGVTELAIALVWAAQAAP